MTARQTLALLVAATFVFGVVDAREVERGIQAGGWGILCTVLFSFLSFYWYRLDSETHRYRRTPLLNVGIVMLAIVAVPYYLVRSRPAGRKGRALLRLAGFCVLLFCAGVSGGMFYALMS